ncbi:MAG: peptide chain release factor aRF-1 [Candidatus Diapherotrites archaeon]|nr:peptide chain release factor aRF-1 [Candidatus Diapherotrites archaeon]
MKKAFADTSEADAAVFKKKLRRLAQFKGRGTELISLFMPPDVDRGTIMSQITEEMSQSSNIKSPTTRKNVQGALRKVQNFLKTIDFDLPENGLAVFCGNISEREGKSDIQLFTVKPLKKLNVKLYWCDSEFHLDPLRRMAAPSDIFALLAIDGNEATIAMLVGKRYEILGHFTSGVSGKHRAGGFSANRFARLHEEATHEFYKRIAEKMNAAFIQGVDKLKGIIVAGPGLTKNYFLDTEFLDHRLRQKVLGTADTTYTDESGIREAINKSDDLLKDADITKEIKIVNDFLTAVAKTELAAYGQKEVEEALAVGKVSTLLLSEGIEWQVYKFKCSACGAEEEVVVKEPEKFEEGKYRCGKCGGSTEFEEQMDYADWIMEKAQNTGAETRIISTETTEGEQFLRGFGGIGAILRYR